MVEIGKKCDILQNERRAKQIINAQYVTPYKCYHCVQMML